MARKIATITLGLILFLQIFLQSAVQVSAADGVLIKSPQPGNRITGEYLLCYDLINLNDPLEIRITYLDVNSALAEVNVTPVASSTGKASYETKIAGLGEGLNTITVEVSTASGAVYSDRREVTVNSVLTNIVGTENNVAPHVSDRNKFKNLLKENNSARASESKKTAKDDAYIDRFIDILFEEAALENIRPDIVFTQMMLETGWLVFSHTVRENQNNFGGIGATGNGVRGNLFLSMRDGIRVNVQHLKAYASKEALKGPLVDPRFGYVARGTAPWVEHLGYQENPNRNGWAMSYQYGYQILNIIRRLDSASAEPFQVRRVSPLITEFEAGSITRGKWNDLDVKFTEGFAPGREVRLGVATNSDTEHRFVVTNKTRKESSTTPWSEERAAFFMPKTAGLYQFRTEIRQKGTTEVLATKTIEVQIGDPEPEPEPDPDLGIIPVIGSVSLSSSPYHPEKPVSITIADTSTATARVNEYQLEIEHNGTKEIISSWSARRTYTFTPERTGDYLLRVAARNRLVGGEANQSITVSFKVESPRDPNHLIASVSASSQDLHAGTEYAITVTPVADPGRPVEYRLVQLAGDKMGLIGSWRENPTFTFRPGIHGAVTLQAQARNKGGDGKILHTKDLDLEVARRPGDMEVEGEPFVTGKKISAKIVPFAGWDSYEFRLYLQEGPVKTPLTKWQTAKTLEFTPAFSGRATLLAVPRHKATGKELAPQLAAITINRGNVESFEPADYIPENPESVKLTHLHAAGVKAVGNELTISALTSHDNLLYRFYLLDPMSGERTVLEDWSQNSSLKWKAEFGRFTLVAEVRHPSSRGYYDHRIEMPLRVKNYPTVYLDAGHGGSDPGYVVQSGGITYREADLTLEMAKAIQTKLKGRGINVFLSRSGNQDVTLEERVALSEENSSDLFVALHYTTSSNKATTGVRTYFAGSKTDPLAERELIRGQEAASLIGPAMSRYYDVNRGISSETSALGYSIRVLKETSMPAVQLNLGYMSSAGDMVRITSAWYRDQIAGAIADSILSSLNP